MLTTEVNQITAMKTRKFGVHEEELPILGLGCSRIGSFNNPTPITEIRNTLACALECGVTLFDTADIYGQGDSEREIGRVLQKRGDKAFVVTKVGYRFSTKMRLIRPFKPLLKALIGRSSASRRAVTSQRGANMNQDFSPEHIAGSVDASLRRLKRETIDGLLLHDPPATVVAMPEIVSVLASLRAAGKIRHYGVSCGDLETLRATLAMPGVSLLQIPLVLFDEIEAAGLTDALRESKIAIFAREVISAQPNLPPATAVAQALKHQLVTSVIIGTSKPGHLKELASSIG